MLKKLLDAGSDLIEVYQPYRQSMATILEIPMDKIDLNDPTLTNAITDKGNMTIFDFKKSLRKDPRWQYTDNAREIVLVWINTSPQRLWIYGVKNGY
jgi:hypothetical protein